MFIDQGESYPIAIHKKLLRAISPKIGNFARAIKSSRDHVCASADAIASDRSCKTKRPETAILCSTANIDFQESNNNNTPTLCKLDSSSVDVFA